VPVGVLLPYRPCGALRDNRALLGVPGCVTLCYAESMEDGLDWVPADGVALSPEEVRRILRALRALIAGTDLIEPNRSHAVEVAVILAEALERQEGAS